MNRFGTRLSLGLYWAMVLIGLLLILGAVMGALLIAGAIASPTALLQADAVVNGHPVTSDNARAAGAIIIAACALGGLVLWQLIGLLRTAAEGEPFVTANVTRLRIAAGGLALAGFAGPLAGLLTPVAMGDARGEIDGGSLLGALLALVLAEVFRAGVALSDDATGTV